MALSFFNNIDEFRKWIKGIDASTDINDVSASYNPAKDMVFGIIEQTLWNQLKAYHENPDPENEHHQKMVEYIQSALANFTMIQEFPYIAATDSKDWYKYEVDGQINRYRDNGWSALNNIITYLDAHFDIFTEWPNTSAYKERQKLIISNYIEFDNIYSIDKSAYFFYQIIFIQKEVIRDIILPKIIVWEEISSDSKVTEAVKNAIVYQTMAWAIQRLDYVNLPKSIRNLIANEQTKVVRSGTTEKAMNDDLAAILQTKANKYIGDVEYEIERINSLNDEEEVTRNYNEDDNKFYLMT